MIELRRGAGLFLLGGCLAGIAQAAGPQPYLDMPRDSTGPFPRLLSQTGVFVDTARLIPREGLLPYELNVSFWADGARKRRWMALPPESKIGFSPQEDWAFPAGTVFVKHFELATNETAPNALRRLETRLLVRTADGSVYGGTYKWRPDNGDAELLATNLTEAISIQTATGTRTQVWYYPSREDCRICHTDRTGGVLGVKTRQLNREARFGDAPPENQLRKWSRLGLLDVNLSEAMLAGCDRLAPADDPHRSLEDRARSYLDANCSNCHRPGGTVAYFDARYTTPLAQQGLIEGQVLLDEGIDGAHIISPHDTWRSILFVRATAADALKMPPVAHETLDTAGAALLREWIDSMPGPPVLPPPSFSLAAGNYSKPIELTLRCDVPGATIRYTLDGSKPTTSDAVYTEPIRLSGPTTVRAKAFKPGFTKSVTAQETFIIGE
jgi:uncharacterized repeat protein (TIGR03806 family)